MMELFVFVLLKEKEKNQFFTAFDYYVFYIFLKGLIDLTSF